jgi:RNA polymerase sigma factor for flagellar operon FliA
MGTGGAAKGRVSPQEIEDLWRSYKDGGDPRLRDRLVLTLAPLVKYVVYRKLREIPAQCETEDFISCGIEALIWAIDRYDPARGATLEQFAWTRIHGAVLDELRRNDWAPRSLRRWGRDIGRARQQFTSLYGRRPDQQELSGALGITVRELTARQDEIGRSEVGSLNTVAPVGDEDSSVERIDTLQSRDRDIDPEWAAMRSDAGRRLGAALQCLSERDRQIAVLLYVYNLTLRETGEILGVTDSRVCQLHGALTRKLRTLLSADEQLFSEVA